MIKEGLRSPDLIFSASKSPAKSFVFHIKTSSKIGTEGQKFIRVVLSKRGKLRTAFPVRRIF